MRIGVSLYFCAHQRDGVAKSDFMTYPHDFALIHNLPIDGSPKAIDRMVSYIHQARPRTEEMLVDEMLAICAEIEAWRQKKESQEAHARYNSWLYYKKWNPDEEE